MKNLNSYLTGNSISFNKINSIESVNGKSSSSSPQTNSESSNITIPRALRGSQKCTPERVGNNGSSAENPYILTPKEELNRNVQTVSTATAKGRLEIFIDDMVKYGLDVACITEARIAGKGDLRVLSPSNGLAYTVTHSGHEQHSINGVAVVVSEKAKHSLVSRDCINDRLMVARFAQTTGYLSVIVVYAPTDATAPNIKDTFYAELRQCIANVPKQDMIIVAGDLNAEVGASRDGWERTLGPFGVGNRNDNGERLLNFAADYRLKIANSFFKHRRSHQLTWYSNAGNAEKMLDYVLVCGRFFSAVSDVRVRNGTALPSDHRLVVCRLQ